MTCGCYRLRIGLIRIRPPAPSRVAEQRHEEISNAGVRTSPSDSSVAASMPSNSKVLRPNTCRSRNGREPARAFDVRRVNAYLRVTRLQRVHRRIERDAAIVDEHHVGEDVLNLLGVMVVITMVRSPS